MYKPPASSRGWPPVREVTCGEVRWSEPVCVAAKGAEVEDCQEEGKLVRSGASPRIDDFQQTFGESGPGGCRYPIIVGHGIIVAHT